MGLANCCIQLSALMISNGRLAQPLSRVEQNIYLGGCSYILSPYLSPQQHPPWSTTYLTLNKYNSFWIYKSCHFPKGCLPLLKPAFESAVIASKRYSEYIQVSDYINCAAIIYFDKHKYHYHWYLVNAFSRIIIENSNIKILRRAPQNSQTEITELAYKWQQWSCPIILTWWLITVGRWEAYLSQSNSEINLLISFSVTSRCLKYYKCSFFLIKPESYKSSGDAWIRPDFSTSGRS